MENVCSPSASKTIEFEQYKYKRWTDGFAPYHFPPMPFSFRHLRHPRPPRLGWVGEQLVIFGWT